MYPFFITEGKEYPKNFPDNLKQIALTLLDPATCRDQMDGYSYAIVITDKMICASRGISGQGICQVSDVVLRKFSVNTRLFLY